LVLCGQRLGTQVDDAHVVKQGGATLHGQRVVAFEEQGEGPGLGRWTQTRLNTTTDPARG
jgi:hypothetical protein